MKLNYSRNMQAINLVIGDKNGKSYSKKIEDNSEFAGKKLGEMIKGELAGLSGYELKITGGSNDAGFPMRAEINLAGKKKIYARKGIGINAKYKGNFVRKTVAGNTVYQKTSQLNLAVVKAGKKSLEETFGKKEEVDKIETQG
ncbi:30S ribosomal protein S6e [Candidatus Woesearchaeota archaeon]|nr:30S ribosomal protein S6e [Candidatus Woesearchaeota archaeon]